jgi:hypothetical protein
VLSGGKSFDLRVSEGESYRVLPAPRLDITTDHAQFDGDVARLIATGLFTRFVQFPHDGTGSPASICSLRQRWWMAYASGSTDLSHISPTVPG